MERVVELQVAVDGGWTCINRRTCPDWQVKEEVAHMEILKTDWQRTMVLRGETMRVRVVR